MKSAASRTPASDLRAGLEHHRAGRFAEAERCYRSVLATAPRQADALNLLGLLLLGQGRIDDALATFERLVSLKPGVAGHRSNLGHARRLSGDLAGAEAALAEATSADPTCAEAWINLGLTRLDRHDPAGAIDALDRAVALQPESAPAWLNLGVALHQAGRLDDATERLQQATRLAPDLGAAWRNLGLVRIDADDIGGAVACFEEAVRIDPADADSRTNLGVLLWRRGDLDTSLAHHAEATRVAPQLAEAWLNRGTALHHAGRLEEARLCLTRAAGLDLGPRPRTALGSVAADLGDLDGAVREHRAALAADPECADAHWNLSLALLAQGNLAEGWDEYEWRWRASSRVAALRPYPAPRWEGEPVAGRRVLVWREQGLGDELMFLTAVPALQAAGGVVTLSVSPRLVSLVERSFPGVTVVADRADAAAATRNIDVHTPLGSLPRWFRRSVTAFGAHPFRLVPDPERCRRWAARLAALGPGPRVGVCWRSGLITVERQRRYPALEAWRPVWAVPGIQWINLQYDDCTAELAAIEAESGVTIHRWDGEDLRDDLESVVALLASLDAVVTAPTAVSSLAGAVGVPAWQIDDGSDWTAHGAGRSPWFPSLNSIRRERSESGWEPAMARLAAVVRDLAAGGIR